MADVAFYHLTRSRADDALPPLLAKTLAVQKRALVCCRKEDFSRLSTAIWSRQANSWLPHGIAGKHDADKGLCPIWLADKVDDAGYEADFLFFLDGAVPEDLPQAERVFILFDGTDEAAVQKARECWKALGKASGEKAGGEASGKAGGEASMELAESSGHALSYWQQDEGGGWSRAR